MHAQYIVKRKLLGRLYKFRHRNSVLTLIKKRMLISEVKINILSGYLSALSTSANGSPDMVSLYLFWSTWISLTFNGIWGMLTSSRAFWMLYLIAAIEGKFLAVSSEIFSNCSPRFAVLFLLFFLSWVSCQHWFLWL